MKLHGQYLTTRWVSDIRQAERHPEQKCFVALQMNPSPRILILLGLCSINSKMKEPSIVDHSRFRDRETYRGA